MASGGNSRAEIPPQEGEVERTGMDQAAVARAQVMSREHRDVIKLRIRVWDGDKPLIPVILVDYLHKDMRIYNSRSKSALPLAAQAGVALSAVGASVSAVGAGVRAVGAEMTAAGTSMAGASAGARSVAMNARRLATSKSGSADMSVESEVLKSHEFHKVVAAVQALRSDAIYFEPTVRKADEIRFYYRGKRVRRSWEPRIVDVMDHSRGETLGWSENELDLALNAEAERFLKSRHYRTSLTFSVTVEAAELSHSAMEKSPFGLKPTTYLTLSHGKAFRVSHVVHATMSPVFEWTGGAVLYEPDEPLRLRLHMARDPAGKPSIENDYVVGNVFLDAGFLPPPRTLAAPELMTASLGLSVGVLQFSVRGPAYASSRRAGCVLYPCGEAGCAPYGERCCALYVCGLPPRCPAYSVLRGECNRSCQLQCLRSKTCLYNSFCCCFSLGPSGGLLGTGWWFGQSLQRDAPAVPGSATAV